VVDFDYEWFDVHSLAVVGEASHESSWAVPSVHVAVAGLAGVSIGVLFLSHRHFQYNHKSDFLHYRLLIFC